MTKKLKRAKQSAILYLSAILCAKLGQKTSKKLLRNFSETFKKTSKKNEEVDV